MLAKSSTDDEEPRRPQPYVDKLDPGRAKDRRDRLEPQQAKSRTDNELPIRTLPYTDEEDPRRAKVRSETGIGDLHYVTPEDRNQISLLYYAEAGDGIDWHFDGNIYLGQRWAGIFPLFEETADDTTKLELEVDGEVLTFDRKEVHNTLLLFQGDQVKHRVRPMTDGEERLVVNLLFSPTPNMTSNPILRLYQTWVNYMFYGKLDK